MSAQHRLARWAQLSYPPSFRERYGEELAALVDDVEPSAGHTVDLLRNAALAWLRPAVVGRGPEGARRRMQASVSTVWVAWAAGFLVAPAVNRALLDPPLPAVDPEVRTLLGVASWAVGLGWVLALIAGVPLGLRVLSTAWRTRRAEVLLPLVPALALLVLETAGTGALVLLAPGRTGPGRAVPIWLALLGVVWLLGLVALVVAGALGPALALGRARCAPEVLKVPTLLAVPLALALAVAAGASLAATVRSSGGPLTVVPLTVAAVAALVALTSASRGLRAALVS